MTKTKDFTTAAVNALYKVAREKQLLTTDDIWAAIGEHVVCPEPRAMGSIILGFAEAGMIEATDRVQKSLRPVCHKRPLAVWLSKLYVSNINDRTKA